MPQSLLLLYLFQTKASIGANTASVSTRVVRIMEINALRGDLAEPMLLVPGGDGERGADPAGSPPATPAAPSAATRSCGI